MTPKPTHVILRPGDRVTLCGRATRKRDGQPYVAARFVELHRRGRGMVVCTDCERRLPEATDG